MGWTKLPKFRNGGRWDWTTVPSIDSAGRYYATTTPQCPVGLVKPGCVISVLFNTGVLALMYDNVTCCSTGSTCWNGLDIAVCYGASDVWATVSHSHAWPATFVVASCLTEHVTQTSPVYCVCAHSVCQVSLKYTSPPFYLMDVVWFGAYSWVRIVDLARCFGKNCV